MLNRAYSRLDIKSVDEEQRIITGIATTPEPDRMGDIVEPKGAKFKLPIPLLWQHNSREPVGSVTKATVRDDGIEIQAQFAKVDEPGTLKDRLDEAWQSVKAKLVRGLSIGFNDIESAWLKDTYSLHFLQWEWLELSCVTIPANADASIQTIKSCDIGRPAASGNGRRTAKSITNQPGVSGTARVVKMRGAPEMKKPIADQIAGWVNTRSEKAARQDAIQTKASDEGRGKDDAEREEYETLDAEIDTIDKELADLRKQEARLKKDATEAAARPTGDAARTRAADGSQRLVVIEKKLPPGLRFSRFVMAMAQSKGIMSEAERYIEKFFPDDDQLIAFAKTAVAGGTTANGGGPLLQYTDIQTEFVDYLRPLTILGKFGQEIPGGNGARYPDVTRVNFNVRMGSQTAGASASWVGEGKPKPLSKGTFSTATIDFAKVAVISVLTKEEVRFPSINAQTKVRNDLVNAIVARIDTDLVDPANLGTANVKPASITANIVATTPSATTFVGVANDLRTMINAMLAANSQVNSLVLIASQKLALSLSLMRSSLGMRLFPDLTMYGGFLEGIPVIVSEAITSVGSPSTGMLIALNAADLFLADDGVVSVDSSDQASLEMSDAPTQDGTTGGGASMVSLFQTNMLAIRAEREINWKLMRSTSVQYVATPAYVPQ